MVAASRLGDAYDGYLVGAPGYRLPSAAVAQLWGAQQWAPLATPGATTKHPLNPNANIPDLGTAFTAAERRTVAAAILASATRSTARATAWCRPRRPARPPSTSSATCPPAAPPGATGNA